MIYSGTLSSAKAYAEANRLEEWVHLYLLSDGGNKPFSDGIRSEPRFYFGLHQMPLSQLVRCCGPEAHMAYRVNPEDFERRVGGIMRGLREGADLPPLIVQYTQDGFTLNDGNHRHKACERLGIDAVPVVVWITRKDEYDAFCAQHGASVPLWPKERDFTSI